MAWDKVYVLTESQRALLLARHTGLRDVKEFAAGLQYRVQGGEAGKRARMDFGRHDDWPPVFDPQVDSHNIFLVLEPDEVPQVLPLSAPVLDCDGYRRLRTAVETDAAKDPGFHNYYDKLCWAVRRAMHYAEQLGVSAERMLDLWEASRDYWYMNYYQDGNQPLLVTGRVHVFDTPEALRVGIGDAGFRCPHCKGVSRSPYVCDSGKKVKGNVCNWKVYGLFGHLGLGTHIFVKSEMKGEDIFMPVAWEDPVADKPKEEEGGTTDGKDE